MYTKAANANSLHSIDRMTLRPARLYRGVRLRLAVQHKNARALADAADDRRSMHALIPSVPPRVYPLRHASPLSSRAQVSGCGNGLLSVLRPATVRHTTARARVDH